MSDVAPVPAAARRTLRILYADDMRELRDVIRLTLSRDDHRVECAVDGIEALSRIQADPEAFDVLITDHHMPGMNGLDLVRQVRQLPFQGKIIVFSSELSLQVAAAYREQRIDRMVPKPVFPSSLRQMIQALYA